jgi:ribonuclease HI
MGFPAAHIEAMRAAPPGAEVFTDIGGTRVKNASGSVGGARAPVGKRYFDPLFSTAWTGPTTPATLVRYDPEKQVSHTLYSTVHTPKELEAMETSIAIVISGVSHKTTEGTIRAGYGVFFGEGSKFNTKGVVDPSQKQTSKTADITAALKSLEGLDEVRNSVGLMEVVIITDSDYLVKSMCEYVRKWVKNGFKTDKGKKLENQELLRSLNERIEELEEEMIEVKFWQVGSSMVEKAEGLVKEALALNSRAEA